jgi:hypothetical protein
MQMKPSRIEDFSHLLKALSAGCPPHAGFAIGFDRLIAVMRGTDSVRDVIAFPKNSKGGDMLVKSPRRMSRYELERYHLRKMDIRKERYDATEDAEEEDGTKRFKWLRTWSIKWRNSFKDKPQVEQPPSKP